MMSPSTGSPSCVALIPTTLRVTTLAKLRKGVDLKDKDLEPYAKLLTEWDGRLTVDSKAGPLYAIWLKELQQGFYGPHVPKELASSLVSLGGLPLLLHLPLARYDVQVTALAVLSLLAAARSPRAGGVFGALGALVKVWPALVLLTGSCCICAASRRPWSVGRGCRCRRAGAASTRS